MSDEKTRGPHAVRIDQESYTSGGVTYVGAARSRHGRLQDAVEEFRRQADWLAGYLFIVGEHFEGGRRDITGQAAVSYLEAVPSVATDVRAALEDVERLAADLRRAMADSTAGAGPS